MKIIFLIIKLLKKELTGIVQLGDFVDFFQISTYDKNPDRKNTIKEDLDAYGIWLAKVDALVNAGTHFYQLEGNHEDRLRRYIWAKAPQLQGLVPDIPDILQFKIRNKTCNMKYKWFPMKQWDACKIGDVTLHHGHYFNKHVAVNNLSIYETKFIAGHTHRFQYASNGVRWSVSAGYGSTEPNIGHIPAPHNWQQSLIILTVNDGIGEIEPILIDDGFCIFRSQVINV